MFLIQSAILLAIAFLIGCIVGCILRRLFAREEVSAPVATIAAAAPIAAAVVTPRPAPVAAPATLEPVVAMATVVAKPVMTKPAKPDDLKLIVGIGPVNERKLNALDVTRFAQIAGWSPKDEVSYGEKLQFPGRIEREEWVRQAKSLAAGGRSEDSAELSRRSGKSTAAKLTKAPSISDGKSAPVKAKPIASKTEAVKKPIAMKLDKPIGGKPDNLTLINGIGNVIERKLNEMGVFHFGQIANWTMVQAEAFSKDVGFPGRALREGWVKEAAIFAKGGTTDHAKKVEAGKINTSRISSVAEKGIKKK